MGSEAEGHPVLSLTCQVGLKDFEAYARGFCAGMGAKLGHVHVGIFEGLADFEIFDTQFLLLWVEFPQFMYIIPKEGVSGVGLQLVHDRIVSLRDLHSG